MHFNMKREFEYTLAEFALNFQGILVTLKKAFFSIKNNIYREDSMESVNSFKLTVKCNFSTFWYVILQKALKLTL